MKKYRIVLAFALLLLLTVNTGVRVNENLSVKDPERLSSKDAPGHLVWNEDAGGYYDPGEFEWDPVHRVYTERLIVNDVSLPDEWQEPVEEWIKRHEKSDNPVEQAIIKYYEEWVANRTLEEMISSQFLTPSTKQALRHLVDLGPDHVDEMRKPKVVPEKLRAINLA